MRRRSWRVRGLGALTLTLTLSGCGLFGAEPAQDAETKPGDPTRTPSDTAGDSTRAVEPPGPLKGGLLQADLMVSSHTPISPEVLAKIERTPGVERTTRLAFGNATAGDRVLLVAAVDPAQYRRYTIRKSAYTQQVWDRVAGGEIAMRPGLDKRVADAHGNVRLGEGKDAPRLHVGAYTPQVPRIDAVVNTAWGKELGMTEGTGVLISTGKASPQKVQKALGTYLDKKTSVQVLGPDLDVNAVQTAFLTDSAVTDVVGAFTYKPLAGGAIAPDPAWVAEHIETREMPILGSMRCNKAIFPQLEAALKEIQQRGLADKLNPGEYGGCYVPRFIANSTSLSLHSFGIAFDVNVPGNQRGTAGEIDRQVVAILQRWGFEWGGDWNWTGPMHFQMNAVITPR